MKKAVALLLALSMVLSLCGCGNSQKKDYEKAISLFDEGSYEEAQAIFEELGDYEDSSSYVEKCKIEAKYAIKNTMTEEEFKEQCIKIRYEDLMRNPNRYIGEFVKLEGRIIMPPEENNNEIDARCYTRNSGGGIIPHYTGDTIHISYRYADENESRLIDDDVIVVYGIFEGIYIFNSMAGEVPMPDITVLYCNLIYNYG